MATANETDRRSISEEHSSTVEFKSRFVEDFDFIRFLGKGAFGHVFEVRKRRYDKKFYAVKRIMKPANEVKDNMREVTVSQLFSRCVLRSRSLKYLFWHRNGHH